MIRYLFSILLTLLFTSTAACQVEPVFVVEVCMENGTIQTSDGVTWSVSSGICGFLDDRQQLAEWKSGDEVALAFYCCGGDAPRACFRLKNLRTGKKISVPRCPILNKAISSYQIKEITCTRGYLFSNSSNLHLRNETKWDVTYGDYHTCNWEIDDDILIYPDAYPETENSYILINPSYYLRNCSGWLSQNVLFSCAHVELSSDI